MTQPNKPAALDAVAFLYEHPDTGQRDFSFSRTTSRAERCRTCGHTETPITDLTKAQERIDRLEEMVAKAEAILQQAKSGIPVYYLARINSALAALGDEQ